MLRAAAFSQITVLVLIQPNTKPQSMTKHLIHSLALAALVTSSAQAGAPTVSAKGGKSDQAVAPKEESIFDKIWGAATLCKNPDDPLIQEIAFVGRYHGQYHWADHDTGDSDFWDNRRLRMGLNVKFLKKFELMAQAYNANREMDPFYEGFTELWLAWKPSDAFNLTVGTQKSKFGSEWSTSSRLILPFERGLLISNFRFDFTPGVSIGGKMGKWNYFAGVFANNSDDEFGDISGSGQSYIAQIGYDLKESLGMDQADWRLECIHSTHEDVDTLYDRFDNGIATSIAVKKGKLGATAEVLAGIGGTNGDAIGFMLMPTYDITEKLQLVTRYQLVGSSAEDGLSPQSRYERSAGGKAGDRYQAVYAGLNWYIYGHKLKLMNGVEYANMDGKNGFDGWTFLSGVRVYW